MLSLDILALLLAKLIFNQFFGGTSMKKTLNGSACILNYSRAVLTYCRMVFVFKNSYAKLKGHCHDHNFKNSTVQKLVYTIANLLTVVKFF